jgi:hypothetical protein
MSETTGRGLLMVMIDVDPAHEDEFNRWYDEEHLPERRGWPGILSARRFKVTGATPIVPLGDAATGERKSGGLKYLALYDLESPDVLKTEAYQKLNTSSLWTPKIRPHFTRTLRNVYLELKQAPPKAPVRETGSGLLLVMMAVDPAHEEDFNRWYNEEHLPERQVWPGILRARRFAAIDGPGPKFLALYDLESPDVATSEAYVKLSTQDSPWTLRVRPHRTVFARNVYEELPSPRQS